MSASVGGELYLLGGILGCSRIGPSLFWGCSADEYRGRAALCEEMAKAEPLLGTRAALLHLSRNLKAIAEKIDRLEIVRATSIGLMLRASSKAEMQRLARVQLISSSDTNDTIPRLMTIRQFHMLRMLSGILPKRGVHMRAHLMLVLSAAVIIAMVCATAPLLKVTLNEEGTDVVAVDFSDIVAPKAAVAAEPR